MVFDTYYKNLSAYSTLLDLAVISATLKLTDWLTERAWLLLTLYLCMFSHCVSLSIVAVWQLCNKRILILILIFCGQFHFVEYHRVSWVRGSTRANRSSTAVGGRGYSVARAWLYAASRLRAETSRTSTQDDSSDERYAPPIATPSHRQLVQRFRHKQHHHKHFKRGLNNVNYCKNHRCPDSSDEWW